MDAETRAARDRITAWLAHERRIAVDGAKQIAAVLALADHHMPFPALRADDLDLVLAALGETDDPESGWKPGDIR